MLTPLRDPVWPHTKQSMLVNSLFHRYWVPPVVLAEVVEDGEEIWRVVDGKQRLTSIQNFFAGIVRKQSTLHEDLR